MKSKSDSVWIPISLVVIFAIGCGWAFYNIFFYAYFQDKCTCRWNTSECQTKLKLNEVFCDKHWPEYPSAYRNPLPEPNITKEKNVTYANPIIHEMIHGW